jgi:hypothetical protein
MRKGLTLVACLLLAGVRASSQPAPATKSLAVNCSSAKPVALAYFEQHGFQVAPTPDCSDCFLLKTTHLRNAQNHRFFSTNTVVRRYADTSHDGKDIFGAWYVHSGMNVLGNFRLRPEINGCKAELLFHYSWYATEFLIAMPVDGDPASRPSNLKLEREYLTNLAKQAAKPLRSP